MNPSDKLSRTLTSSAYAVWLDSPTAFDFLLDVDSSAGIDTVANLARDVGCMKSYFMVFDQADKVCKDRTACAHATLHRLEASCTTMYQLSALEQACRAECSAARAGRLRGRREALRIVETALVRFISE